MIVYSAWCLLTDVLRAIPTAQAYAKRYRKSHADEAPIAVAAAPQRLDYAVGPAACDDFRRPDCPMARGIFFRRPRERTLLINCRSLLFHCRSLIFGRVLNRRSLAARRCLLRPRRRVAPRLSECVPRKQVCRQNRSEFVLMTILHLSR